jgi:hypothetical protein
MRRAAPEGTEPCGPVSSILTGAPPISPSDGGAALSGAPAKLRDFSEALRRGDAPAALEAARDACLAEPNRAEAHYAFGQAWMAAGKPARAEQTFAVAAKLRPDFADAWINLGLARYSQGAVEDAKNALFAPFRRSRAIRRRPAISRRFCGSPAATRRPRRCCARPSRAIRRTPGRG